VTREPLNLTPEERAEDEAFFRLYGAWEPLDPAGVQELLAGFDRPWWLVGGWAIEAFTGREREHEDVDLSILGCDVPALRAHLEPAWHLWSNNGGTLRPLNDKFPEPQHPESQIWIREYAAAPWILDLPLTPDRDGLWSNKRLPGHVAPVEEVTWVADDGIRYLNPEIVLLFKSRLDRPKDRRDFDVTWPLLDAVARAWLAEAVRGLDSEHGWLSLINRA
jgi:hypothetical protein